MDDLPFNGRTYTKFSKVNKTKYNKSPLIFLRLGGIYYANYKRGLNSRVGLICVYFAGHALKIEKKLKITFFHRYIFLNNLVCCCSCCSCYYIMEDVVLFFYDARAQGVNQKLKNKKI